MVEKSVKKHGNALVQLYLVHSWLYLVHGWFSRWRIEDKLEDYKCCSKLTKRIMEIGEIY